MSFKSNYIIELKHVNGLVRSNDIFKHEQASFTLLNGQILDRKSRLIREYAKLLEKFTFTLDVDLSFKKTRKIQILLDKISRCIDDETNFVALEKIIVLLDLSLGLEVSFYSSFYELNHQFNVEKMYDLINNFSSFEELCEVLGEKYEFNF